MTFGLGSGSLDRTLKAQATGTSLAVQWLRLRAPNAGGTGSIPGLGTKIPHAAWRGQKQTNKQSSSDRRNK